MEEQQVDAKIKDIEMQLWQAMKGSNLKQRDSFGFMMSYKQFIDKDDNLIAKRNVRLFMKDLVVGGLIGFGLAL